MRVVDHPGYRARNMDVTECERLNARLCAVSDRMRQRRDCPNWLILELSELIHKADCLTTPLKHHRDEIPPTMEI